MFAIDVGLKTQQNGRRLKRAAMKLSLFDVRWKFVAEQNGNDGK